MAKIFAPNTPDISQRGIDHMVLTRKMAGECMVLLQNNGILPLRKRGKVALFGAGTRKTIQGGTGSGAVYTRSNVPIERGLENAGFEITTKEWITRHEERCKTAHREYMEWVPQTAKEQGCEEIQVLFENPYHEPEMPEITADDVAASDTDTVVYVLSRNSGEGADRFAAEGDYFLSEMERKHIKAITVSYRHVIVVLNIGGVMDLSELKQTQGISAILLMT